MSRVLILTSHVTLGAALACLKFSLSISERRLVAEGGVVKQTPFFGHRLLLRGDHTLAGYWPIFSTPDIPQRSAPENPRDSAQPGDAFVLYSGWLREARTTKLPLANLPSEPPRLAGMCQTASAGASPELPQQDKATHALTLVPWSPAPLPSLFWGECVVARVCVSHV